MPQSPDDERPQSDASKPRGESMPRFGSKARDEESPRFGSKARSEESPRADSKSRDEDSPRSVLQILGERNGFASKVLLSDVDSEAGSSPIVDPAAAAKLVPQGRGNYQLLGEIARGGMGVILKGHDTDLGRDIAVKVLSKEMAARPTIVQRFIEEAQIGGQLQHPGIVPVYELGLMADDCPYFTMKLVKGRTLAALLAARKTPTEDRGRHLAIFESVCQTMAYAHSKGVLHRDLKPANVMVGAFGEVQVVDWGLAKVLHRGGVADEKRAKETIHTVIETVRSGPRGQHGSSTTGTDSIAGSVMGTPAYMAPEQAQGEVDQLDERADVFSLGAILCELLTGRPPYETNATEDVVTQAARARLEPAKKRLETCEADPALVALCLDCLSASRAGRPANAGEVAKAMHAYLTSVEARAQKAELAALEARHKADEERRARKMTLALGGVVAAALLLGGGGWYYVNHEREKRIEQTRAVVEAAHGEAIEFGRAGKATEALASARRALTLAETGDADAALLERARGFVTQAEADLAAAEREHGLREQDERLRERLIALRIEQIGTLGNREREKQLDGRFAEAFRDYGVDLEGDDLVPALKRIRERAIAGEVALALDDWGRVRRHVHGAQSEQAENLFVLAMDLDPDPRRQRLRQAIADNDLDALLELGTSENLPKLAPGSIFVLGAALWDSFPEHRPDVFRMFDEALHLHPSDYVLQSVGGNIYDSAGRVDSSLTCRAAALTLRPHDASAQLRMAEALSFLGRLTDAVGALRACIAEHPDHQEALWSLGTCLNQLGKHEEALAMLQRALKVEDQAELRADVLGTRFLAGLATKNELEALALVASTSLELVNTLYPLVDHPDPAQRDPEFVQRMLRDRRSIIGQDVEFYIIDAVSRVRAGDWSGALAALEGRYYQTKLQLITPNAFDFIRSLIYSKLENREAARECYQRGMAEWKLRTGGNPAAWIHSDTMRWRVEAEAALAK